MQGGKGDYCGRRVHASSLGPAALDGFGLGLQYEGLGLPPRYHSQSAKLGILGIDFSRFIPTILRPMAFIRLNDTGITQAMLC